MFVIGPKGDNKEFKAHHVPGQEIGLTSTLLSLKSRHPAINARIFFLFSSVLDVPEFSVQAHFLAVGTGLSHGKISHKTVASNVSKCGEGSMSIGIIE